METSTRRAFALDSRTVWVEQQLVNSTVVARDNLVLGPGEYNVKLMDRHVSTPSLGGPKRGIDFMPSFQSDLRTRTASSKGSPSRVRSPVKQGLTGSSFELRDFSTSFHEHDTRQPFDPKNGFCPTPGSYLAHTPVLKMVRHDGVCETKSTLPFGPNAPSERVPTRQALPDYDPNFDSPQLRPATTLGSFHKAKRIYIPSAKDSKPGEEPYLVGERSPVRSPQGQRNSPDKEQKMSVFQMRCSLVPMPKLKHRSPPVLIFDASSYKDERISKPLGLTPKQVNAKAQVHLYDKILAIPRRHQSTGVAAGKLVVRPVTTGGSGYVGEGDSSVDS
jgi:hypothetical protein